MDIANRIRILSQVIFLMFILLTVTSIACAEGLSPYPDPVEVYEKVRALAGKNPVRVEIFSSGQSVGSRDILCLRIHRGDGQERPAALIGGAIHGDEYIANRTAMAVAETLIEEDDPMSEKVLERMDVYVLPLINPDGYSKTWESGGDDEPKETRTNDNRVDLNRNFGKPKVRIPLPLGYSGSKNPGSSRWVGPAPFSEPEAQAVRRLAQEHEFFAAVDFHCNGGMIIPVLNDHRYTQKGLRKMAKAYRKAQSDPYGIYMFPYWIPIYQGSMEECLLREAGALAVLIELCKPGDLRHEKSKDNHFWSFNPYEPEVIERVARDNARASLAALLEAYNYTGGESGPRPVDVY